MRRFPYRVVKTRNATEVGSLERETLEAATAERDRQVELELVIGEGEFVGRDDNLFQLKDRHGNDVRIGVEPTDAA